MEWQLIIAIAGFVAVGISLAASVLLDRERPAADSVADADRSQASTEPSAPLEGSSGAGYDRAVHLGGGARAARQQRGTQRKAGGMAGDAKLDEMNKSYDKHSFVGRASAWW